MRLDTRFLGVVIKTPSKYRHCNPPRIHLSFAMFFSSLLFDSFFFRSFIYFSKFSLLKTSPSERANIHSVSFTYTCSTPKSGLAILQGEFAAPAACF